MKSSLRQKTNISREKLAVLEELLSEKQREYEAIASEYNEKNKSREIDMLWDELHSQKSERSPGIYLSVGFVVGAMAMFLMTSIINFGVKSDNTSDFDLWKKSSITTNKKTNINIAPTTDTTPVFNGKTMSYIIQDGDTLETIALKYYGAASPANIMKIQNFNNIKNPNSIQIGQKIIEPLTD